MGDLIGQLWTPELQIALTTLIVLVVILYVLSIIWVIRDAYMRGTQWWLWGIISLVPGIGIIAYLLLRPPLMQIDREEQELEIALKQRQLMDYGECAHCGYPVESSYVLCPRCLTQLKNLCSHCEKALDPSWTVCPYCATPVTGARKEAPHREHSSYDTEVRSESSHRERSNRRQSRNPRLNQRRERKSQEAAAALEAETS